MNTNDTHNIDNQVRQATNSIDTEFNEAAWVKMEKLLNQKQKSPLFFSFFNWKKLFLGLLLLNAVVIAFYLNKKQSNKTSKNSTISTSTINSQSQNPKIELQKNAENIIVENNKNHEVLNNNNVKINNNSISSYTYQKLSKSILNINETKSTKSKNKNIVKQSNELENYKSVKLQSTDVGANSTTIVKDENKKDAVDILNDIRENKSEAEKNLNLHKNTIDSKLKNSSVKANTLQTNNLTADKEFKKSIKDPNFVFGLNKIYIALAKSIEINTVKLRGNNTITSNQTYAIGAMLSNKNSININYTKALKIYDTDKYGYKNLNPYYALFDTLNIHARCNISTWDINVKHFFNHFQKSTWFVSGGLGLSKLITEAYYYEYFDRGILRNRYRSFQNAAMYRVTNINFLAGYQYFINKQFSLFSEVFLQYPIKGVGVGTINITGIGAKLGLTFFPFK